MYAKEALPFPVAASDDAVPIELAAGAPALPVADSLSRVQDARQVRPRESVDTVLAFAALVASLLLTIPVEAPLGPGSVLQIRLSLLDLLLGGGFLYLWPRLLRLSGVYEARQAGFRGELFSILVACTAGSVLAAGVVEFDPDARFTLETVTTFWVLSVAVTLTFRGFAQAVNTTIRVRRPRKVLIVGSGARALRLYRELRADPEVYEVIGFVDDGHAHATAEISSRMRGSLGELEELLMRQVVDEVLIALPIKSCYTEIQSTIQTCERVGVASKYLADAFRCTLAKATTYDHHVGLPFMSMKVAYDDYRVKVKRLIDFTAALLGVIALSPLLLGIALAVRLTSQGPIIFAQERYGLNKRRFRMYKFRTMVVNAEELQRQLEEQNEALGPVFKIRNDPRITPIGRFLRKTSLDELPQLFNVLLGDMSLVGPRPLPVRDVQLFDQAWFMRRFSVPPGLTCLWQISGRSNLGFDDWVTLDLKYIDEWSLALDLQILARTIPAVVRGVGAA